MTVVVGTAGHIDHGKTTLLRALTGIDADRLPEERRRGMTIDVGYAHMTLPDGSALDFVDVPGHDGLVGNMLVGAGEADAAMLVVAADDGPRAQTLEHLELLDAFGLRDALAVVTKADLVPVARAAAVADETRDLLARTTLAGGPVVVVSAATGAGLDELRDELLRLQVRALARSRLGPAGPLRLPIDRVFAIRGRGTVVTGSLRGGGLARETALRLEPGGAPVRIRELQVHGSPVAIAPGGRTAVNVAGTDAVAIGRGAVLTDGPGVTASDRLLVRLRPPAGLRPPARPGGHAGTSPSFPLPDGAHLRLHLGTDQVDVRAGRRGRESSALGDGSITAVLRLSRPVATFVGDHLLLRRPSPGEAAAGGIVLDPAPPRGISRRRIDPERLAGLAAAVDDGDPVGACDAIVALHGAVTAERLAAVRGSFGAGGAEHTSAHAGPGISGGPAGGAASAAGGELVLAPDLADRLERLALELIREHHATEPGAPGLPVAGLRSALATDLRRAATWPGAGTSGHRSRVPVVVASAVDRILAGLVQRGLVVRAGDRLHLPGHAPELPARLVAAMDRLEALLDMPAPPGLAAAAATAGCPADGIRALRDAGRIVVLEDDLAWSARAYGRLAAQALGLASRAPLTPAALRDASGTSRKYVLAILEDLDRRGILRRTDAGHVPGPRAPRAEGAGPREAG
jgi:selenocysteine-specific elongation factor